jgi:hypothetical protein
MKQMRSDEEIISNVKELLAKNPRANRSQIFKVCKVGLERFNSLVERKLISLPPPEKSGKKWRNFQL